MLALASVLALAAAGCGSTKMVTKTITRTVAAAATAKTGVGAPAEQVQFGYIKSLKKHGADYRMQFDPAWFLGGTTANVAAAQDGAVSPGEPVPNDNYVVDEGHRLLTYVAPADARVDVLKTGVTTSPISVAQLAQLVAGKNPFPKPLYEGLETGFWVRVHIDTVRSIDQQYHP